jgi:hypothetical protein
MSDTPSTNGEFSANGSREEMESRLRRLESAIAAIADTKIMEERLVEKVMSRVEPPPAPPVAAIVPLQPAPPQAMPVPPEMLIAAGKVLLPSALNAVSAGFAAATDPHNLPQKPSILSPQSWLLLDFVQELRTFGMMFLDYRFQPSWTVKIIPAVCLILIVVNFILFGGLLHLVDIPLTILSYKTMSREANRYRTEMALLPRQ